MKAFRKIFALVAAAVTLIFIAVNLFLGSVDASGGGRPYRVEIKRLARQIEQDGVKSVDLSEYEYVRYIEKYGDAPEDDFYNREIPDGHSAILRINGELYRFDYLMKNDGKERRIVIGINAVLAVMAALVSGVLLYIREKILRPFEEFANLPYELSRGNLTVPVKDDGSRFFGKFLWGIDLLRENIEQQKRRELELHKEKKTLLLSLSHDLKTPLSAIKLYAKALSKNLYSDTAKQRRIAESINEKADEIEAYVSQIITASREDFLSFTVENGEFFLTDLVQRIEEYYREKLSLVKTEFVVGKYENCLLSGDLERSVEVLQNVMENAIKYGDGKRVEILFPEEETGVLVAVKNSGCTLDKACLPHIFESFWRGGNAGEICGSGLGLYICRQLMHRMNGEIFAQMDGDTITVTAVFCRV